MIQFTGLNSIYGINQSGAEIILFISSKENVIVANNKVIIIEYNIVYHNINSEEV